MYKYIYIYISISIYIYKHVRVAAHNVEAHLLHHPVHRL